MKTLLLLFCAFAPNLAWAGGATHFSVTSSGSTVAGVALNVTVTAKDATNATATGYLGTVASTSTDAAASLPATYTFTAGDAGVHIFSSVTLKTAGSQTFTATDTATGSITGSTGITVSPAAATQLTLSGPATLTAGICSAAYTITAADPFGNASNVTSTTTVDLTSPGSGFWYGTAVCTSLSIASTTIINGTSSAIVYLKDDFAEDTTLTAADALHALTSANLAIAVGPGPVAELGVTSFPSAVVAGVSQNVTVTAKDALGNINPNYTGTVHFTSSDGQAALPGNYTFQASDNGTRSFPITLKTSGTQSVAATDTVNGLLAGSEAGIAVSPANAVTVSVAGFANPTTAGLAGSFATTLRDSYGNVATGYAGALHFTSTDGQAALPSNYVFIAGDAGVHVFLATLKTAGTQSLSATDTVIGSITGTQNAIIVKAAIANTFTLAGIPTSIVAGTPSTLLVTAMDSFGNVAKSYVGTAHFTSTDPQSALPANSTFLAGDNGTKSLSVTLKTVGIQAVTATDTTTGALTGSETAISVAPGTAAQLTLVAQTTSLSQGGTDPLTLTALDAYGNIATGYTGAVIFSSSDPVAVLPPNHTFVLADSGAWSASAMLNHWGSQTVSATGPISGVPFTGQTTSITVSPLPFVACDHLVAKGYQVNEASETLSSNAACSSTEAPFLSRIRGTPRNSCIPFSCGTETRYCRQRSPNEDSTHVYCAYCPSGTCPQ